MGAMLELKTSGGMVGGWEYGGSKKTASRRHYGNLCLSVQQMATHEAHVTWRIGGPFRSSAERCWE